MSCTVSVSLSFYSFPRSYNYLLDCADFGILAFAYPASIELMNWNSVILVGTTALTGVWWFIHGARKYPGPAIAHLVEAGKL